MIFRGASSNIRAALDLLSCLRKGMPLSDAFALGNAAWADLTKGDPRVYSLGQQQADGLTEEPDYLGHLPIWVRRRGTPMV